LESLGARLGRLAGGVAEEDLDLPAAERVAALLQRELEPFLHLAPTGRDRSGANRQHAEPHRLLRRSRPDTEHAEPEQDEDAACHEKLLSRRDCGEPGEQCQRICAILPTVAERRPRTISRKGAHPCHDSHRLAVNPTSQPSNTLSSTPS